MEHYQRESKKQMFRIHAEKNISDQFYINNHFKNKTYVIHFITYLPPSSSDSTFETYTTYKITQSDYVPTTLQDIDEIISLLKSKTVSGVDGIS